MDGVRELAQERGGVNLTLVNVLMIVILQQYGKEQANEALGEMKDLNCKSRWRMDRNSPHQTRGATLPLRLPTVCG